MYQALKALLTLIIFIPLFFTILFVSILYRVSGERTMKPDQVIVLYSRLFCRLFGHCHEEKAVLTQTGWVSRHWCNCCGKIESDVPVETLINDCMSQVKIIQVRRKW